MKVLIGGLVALLGVLGILTLWANHGEKTICEEIDDVVGDVTED